MTVALSVFQTPLHYAAGSTHGAMCLEILTNEGANVNIQVKKFSDVLGRTAVPRPVEVTLALWSYHGRPQPPPPTPTVLSTGRPPAHHDRTASGTSTPHRSRTAQPCVHSRGHDDAVTFHLVQNLPSLCRQVRTA